MPITNPAALNMAVPYDGIDNIIGAHTGSFFIAAPTGLPVNASDPFTTGFNDSCLFQGIFSVDSGATWNDFGSMKPDLTTPGEPVFQTVTCQGWVDPTGVFTAYATNYYDNVHLIGTSYTIQYKVVFFAKDTQGLVTPIPTQQILAYQSAYNFQKIFSKGSFANDIIPTPITHNLGYVPKVRAWGTATGSSVYPDNSLLSYDWFGSANFNIEVNTTTATFDAITGYGTVTIFWRIYRDS